MIDDYFVLTAAHCVINENTNEFHDQDYLVVGGSLEANSTSKDVIKIPVEIIYVPTEYNPINPDTSIQVTGDIAVLKVTYSLALNTYKNQKMNHYRYYQLQ